MSRPRTQDAIDAIRKRPRMFLRRDSIRDLSVFLSGYCFGLDSAYPEDFPHGEDLRAFRDWLALRLAENGVVEWETLVLAESDHDDEQAFEAFFVLWSEFLGSKR